MKQKCKKWLSCIAAALLMQPIVPMLFYAGTLPDEYYVRDGQTLTISSALPITAHPVTSIAEASAPASQTAQASLRLFGILPIKTVEIQKTDEILLVPCGQAFGIRMLMDGIMVVEIGEVKTENGICRPAADAGLREGDIIRTVGGKPIDSTESFRSAACTGAPLQLSVLREDKVFETQLTPVYSVQQECWQTGIWVRDSTAGIGTLTYYEPVSPDKISVFCGTDERPKAPLQPVGYFSFGDLNFEVYEGQGGHVPGEIVLIDYAHRVAFTGDVYINLKGMTSEQRQYNQYAPILMTSVDTDPKRCAAERNAILARLGAGCWRICGAHGAAKEYEPAKA